MDLTTTPPLSGWKARFNLRLHPLLAAGVGLGIFALLLPGSPSAREVHSDAEILARLTAPALDLEHGPTFWLRVESTRPELWQEALAACRALAQAPSTNCLALEALARLAPEGAP